MGRTRDAEQTVVIYRLGSLGDTLVALPCFHKVAATWPNARRLVLTNFPVKSQAAPLEIVLRSSGLIDGSLEYPVGTRSLRELLQLALRLRRLRARTLVYLTPLRGRRSAWRDWLFFKACGFRDVIGAPLWKEQQVREKRHGDGSVQQEPECERLVRCLQVLGPIDLDQPQMWDLRLSAPEIQAGAAVIEALRGVPYFAINMGGKAREKDWGFDNWHALVVALHSQYPKSGILAVGAADDFERAQALARAWPGPFVNACGKLEPRESAAAMRSALAFIGHDSGPLHLAAAVGVCCVGLFGNYNKPVRWHPRGGQHCIIHRMQGLHTITVADVLQAVSSVLARQGEHG
jgi:ADP-heptose:LPS heptosyltransferase